MGSTRTPTHAEVIRSAIDARLLDFHTAIPARVVAFDATKQRADCKPLVKRGFVDETDARQIEALPVIPGVPVVFAGGGGFRETWPVKADRDNGDTCILIFSETSLDRWLTGTGAEVDPEVDHGNALTDAVAVLGLRPFGAPLKSFPTDHATIGYDSGPQIHFRSNLITIGDEQGSKAIGLDGDTVDGGKLIAVIAQAGPTVTVTITYLAAGSLAPPVPWFAFSATGVGTPGTYNLSLSGKLQASASQAKAK